MIFCHKDKICTKTGLLNETMGDFASGTYEHVKTV